MNLSQYLRLENDRKLKILCDMLYPGLPPDTIPNYRINKIEERLLDEMSLQKRVLSKLEPSTEAMLMQRLFHNGNISNLLYDFLEEHGLIYSGRIPDDVRTLLIKIFARKASKKLPNHPKQYNPGLFLKFLLFISLIHKEPMEINKRGKRKVKQKRDILAKLSLSEEDEWLIDRFIQFLLRKKAISESEKQVYLNTRLIDDDKRNEIFNSAPQLYSLLEHESFNFALQLAEFQAEPDDWIHTYVFPNLEPTQAIRENILAAGLVRYVEDGRNRFVQLTPEGWFVSKGTLPPCWNEKSILVSADFEVCILHDDNPLHIAIIDHFASLKGNHYFRIYDLPIKDSDQTSPAGLFGDYNKFKQLLLKRSRYIPDVVRYELLS